MGEEAVVDHAAEEGHEASLVKPNPYSPGGSFFPVDRQILPGHGAATGGSPRGLRFLEKGMALSE